MKYIISNKVNGTREVSHLWMDGKLRIMEGTNKEHRLGKDGPLKVLFRISVKRRQEVQLRSTLALYHPGA